MTKRFFIGLLLINATIYLFAEKTPYQIVSFYSDWNFIALNTTIEKQEEYWSKIKNTNEIKIDLNDLSQKDILIIRSMINVAKAVKQTTRCPIQNTFQMICETQMNDDGKYTLNIDKYIIKKNKLIDDSVILYPQDITNNYIQTQKIGQAVNIWELKNNEYSLSIGFMHLVSQ